jgi:DNA helicase IV
VAQHPELAAEQAYLDRAYAYLEASRASARTMTSMVEVGQGGTNQARYERDVIWDTMYQRLGQLELGNAALCFGRIDEGPDDPDHPGLDDEGNPRLGEPGASYYIGRIALSDDNQDPVIVDWRAPVAEPFYRATGRSPMGLVRRRHFALRGRTLLGLEDELFGDALASLGLDGDERRGPSGALDASGRPTISGHGALINALETNRSGKLGDIVATIQGEQDEIIRSELPGVLVVQGGPGTGKTVVALHRAAYLLYTHRFPLEGQGLLVIGPNRLFLSYIDQVLPSLGEAGVELAVLADLVDDVRVEGYDHGLTARVKGDERMVRVIARAVRDRELPLRDDLVVGYGVQFLRLSVNESRRIVDEARRRFRRHNAGRKWVEREVYAALARSGRGEIEPSEVRERLRSTLELREALERMWPVLTPGQLLNDLYGSAGLLAHAGRNLLSDDEWRALYRRRHSDVADVVFTHDDVPLLDEARAVLGPKPKTKRQKAAIAEGLLPDDTEVRTYGHIVVDEAQDLSPLQLRMISRRSLNGSMTVVGDIAQSTGQWAHASWDEVLSRLPDRRPARRAELTVGYRLPGPNMALAARVLRVAAPDLTPPVAVRQDGDPPRVLSTSPEALADTLVDAVKIELDAVAPGNVAVIVPWSLVQPVSQMLADAGVEHGQATRHGLDQRVTVVPVSLAKGLELDATVVVEPAAIVSEETQGMRSLYVALTRSTKRLAVVHARPLPDALME